MSLFSEPVRPGVELRLLETRHAEALYAHVDASREHLGAWLLDVAAWASADDARQFIRGNLDAFASGSGYGFGLWVDGVLAGMIGLGNVQAGSRAGMIGYWVGAAYQGRGLITDGVRVVLRFAFGELGLNRVEITCPADHPASRAIPERLGFVQEGIRRQTVWLRDEPHDEVVYGLLAAEWAAREAR